MSRYEKPPVFDGNGGAKDWIESYEEAATPNGWAAAVRLANFGLFFSRLTHVDHGGLREGNCCQGYDLFVFHRSEAKSGHL